MTQQLFDELTANPPPSTVDVPGIVRREKRRRALLRAGGPAAAVLAVASTITLLAAGGGPAPEPSVAAGPSSAGSAAATPVGGPTQAATTSPAVPGTAAGFRLVADNQKATATTARRLRAALNAAVHHHAPGSTWLAQGLTRNATPDGQPPRIFGDDLTRPTDQMFTGATGIALDHRRGTLSLNIISADPCTGGSLAKCHTEPAKGLYACLPAAQTCTASTRSNGRRQRVQTMTSLGGFVSLETNVELADGRALMLTVDNQFIPPGSRDNHNDIAQRATPLSQAQVTAIATTIGDQILP